MELIRRAVPADIPQVAGIYDRIHTEEESGRAVLEAVLSLPEKYRAPVHLYYYEGYSQKEIAEILGLRLTAVQTRMQRARAILKEVLSDDDAI